MQYMIRNRTRYACDRGEISVEEREDLQRKTMIEILKNLCELQWKPSLRERERERELSLDRFSLVSPDGLPGYKYYFLGNRW